MIARATIAICLTMLAAAPAAAQERELLGVGRLFSNDILGDGRDRWRTGSYVFSYVTGTAPYDDGPRPAGDIIEYRLRGEIIAPGRDDDRLFVGQLSVGAHTHFTSGGLHYALGADIVAVGPQTGLAEFQDAFHETFGLRPPPNDNQVANEVLISGTASAAYPFSLSDIVTLRPFVEAQTGVEDLLRAGGDVLIGRVGQGDLMLRDVVTGQLYRATETSGTGVSWLVGGDVAAVGNSLYLPDGGDHVASETRARARAGVMWQIDEDVSFFYGLTWLGKEFETQPEGQVLGSLKLNFNF